MKRRRNKVTLNFIAPSRNKRSKIVKHVITVNNKQNSSQDSNISWDVNNGQPQSDNTFEVDSADVVQEVSSHTIRKERLSQKWAELRSNIYRTMISRQALPDEAKCYVCGGPAAIRCRQCGPFTLCSDCCTTLHNDKQNHFPELWKVTWNRHACRH